MSGSTVRPPAPRFIRARPMPSGMVSSPGPAKLPVRSLHPARTAIRIPAKSAVLIWFFLFISIINVSFEAFSKLELWESLLKICSFAEPQVRKPSVRRRKA
ncbi:hypothetical protein Holit_03167 [Hollandina sp. SP2]